MGERVEYQCARCGSSIIFEDCPECGGEGYSGHDCGEDSCCCADPEENIPCDMCYGSGTLARCSSSREYCGEHPLHGRNNVKRSTPERVIF
jgi:hypothetical protein